jgi:hypothetical protein
MHRVRRLEQKCRTPKQDFCDCSTKNYSRGRICLHRAPYAPVAGAMPWLLLAAKSVGTQGLFDPVSSIQRINTAGGVAPQTGCTAAAAGTTARIPYVAHYLLFSNQQSTQRTNDQAIRTTGQILGQSRTSEQFFLTLGKAQAER